MDAGDVTHLPPRGAPDAARRPDAVDALFDVDEEDDEDYVPGQDDSGGWTVGGMMAV